MGWSTGSQPPSQLPSLQALWEGLGLGKGRQKPGPLVSLSTQSTLCASAALLITPLGGLGQSRPLPNPPGQLCSPGERRVT